MKSYLSICEDRKTGEIEIKAKFLREETDNLLYIRQIVVEKITKIVSPGCKKVTFEWDGDERI